MPLFRTEWRAEISWRESVWGLQAEKREGTSKEKGIRMLKRSEEMVLPQGIFRLLGLLRYENR